MVHLKYIDHSDKKPILMLPELIEFQTVAVVWVFG